MSDKKKGPAGEPKNKGGRPKTVVDVGAMDFSDVGKFAPHNISFKKRSEVETHVECTLQEVTNTYQKMQARTDIIIEAIFKAMHKAVEETQDLPASLMRLYETYQQRQRQICREQVNLVQLLMKQYELLSELGLPPDEDPRFTPVILELQLQPPADVIVESQFVLPEDDIQPPDPDGP